MLRKLDDKVRALRRVAQRQKQWIALNDYKQTLDEDAMLELETLEAEEDEAAELMEQEQRRRAEEAGQLLSPFSFVPEDITVGDAKCP